MNQLTFNIVGIILTLLYFFLPWGLGVLHIRHKKDDPYFLKYDCFLMYFLFIGVGIQGLITGYLQIVYPDRIAAYVHWPVSPFLIEVGMANIAFGILGILSPLYKRGWLTATGLGYSLFLLMAAVGHLKSSFVDHNFSIGNIGPTLWSDIAIGLSILFLLMARKFENRSEARHDKNIR